MVVKKKVYSISIKKEVMDKLDKKRGRINRSVFIEDILRRNL